MAVWTAWFTEAEIKERWVVNIKERALMCIGSFLIEIRIPAASEKKNLVHSLLKITSIRRVNSPRYHLAFRDFGTAMGLRCLDPESQLDPVGIER